VLGLCASIKIRKIYCICIYNMTKIVVLIFAHNNFNIPVQNFKPNRSTPQSSVCTLSLKRSISQETVNFAIFSEYSSIPQSQTREWMICCTFRSVNRLQIAANKIRKINTARRNPSLYSSAHIHWTRTGYQQNTVNHTSRTHFSYMLQLQYYMQMYVQSYVQIIIIQKNT
jgi:hypothetical protein